MKKSNKNSLINSKKFTKLLIFICIFLLCGIVCKKNINYKNAIYNNVYSNNFSFVGAKKVFDKYLGGIIPLDNLINEKTEMVFNEEINISSFSKYLDGIKVDVKENSLVSVLQSGMIIFKGDKEGYGNVTIVSGIDEVEIWYCNINNSSYKLYDYIEKKDIIGTANGYYYLVFYKDGKFINYEEYLKL